MPSSLEKMPLSLKSVVLIGGLIVHLLGVVAFLDSRLEAKIKAYDRSVHAATRQHTVSALKAHENIPAHAGGDARMTRLEQRIVRRLDSIDRRLMRMESRRKR